MAETKVSPLERVAVALLVVVALQAYHALRLPGLVGLLNDDGLYALSAKALVAGQGYVSLQWPDHPPAIRYPILWPAILALSMLGSADPAVWTDRLQWVAALAGAAFAAGAYTYLRRQVSRWPALVAALAVAIGPKTVELGSHVLSDLAYGAIALGSLIVLERGLEADKPSGRALLWGGVLCGLAFLTRYAAVALIGAVALALLTRRDWRGLGTFAAGCGLIALPWLVFRAAIGGTYYGGEFASAVGLNPFAGLLDQARYLVANACPGLVAAPLLTARSLPLAAAGALVTGLVAMGALRWAASSRVRLGPLFLGLTAVAALAWGMAFPELEEDFLARMLVPVAPLCFVALSHLTPRAYLIYGLSAALAIAQYSADVRVHRRHVAPFLAEGGYQKLFAFIRDKTPPDARLLDWHGPMVAFYTGRTCYTLPKEVTAATFGEVLAADRPDYVLATPRWEARTGTNRTWDVLTTYGQNHPGLLRLEYVDTVRNFALLRVERQ
jgi:4-amino-4-deoxy-L-arabinose transferase-like glycosyltransferase